MKKMLTIGLIGVLCTFGLVALTSPRVFATGSSDVCAGLEATGGSCSPGAAGPSVESIAQTVVKIFTYVVGIIAVITVIVGGFQYVTSGGDSGKVTSAKNTIMYALIGIVIVVLAQVIVTFTISKTQPVPACGGAVTTGCTDPATGKIVP